MSHTTTVVAVICRCARCLTLEKCGSPMLLLNCSGSTDAEDCSQGCDVPNSNHLESQTNVCWRLGVGLLKGCEVEKLIGVCLGFIPSLTSSFCVSRTSAVSEIDQWCNSSWWDREEGDNGTLRVHRGLGAAEPRCLFPPSGSSSKPRADSSAVSQSFPGRFLFSYWVDMQDVQFMVMCSEHGAWQSSQGEEAGHFPFNRG